MTRADRSREGKGPLTSRGVVASLLILAAGCGGEPEPLRSTDRAKAREAVLKKRDNPNLPPGVVTGPRPAPANGRAGIRK